MYRLICIGHILFFSCFAIIAKVQAQDNNDICENKDCSSSIYNVKLDEPLVPSPPTNFSNERTAKFRQAYFTFQQVKSSYANSSDWQSKKSNSMIGGQNCLRHYQIEAHLAHEYLQNPDFKKFIDAQGESNFAEKGFESSRRGLNLQTRLKSNCPKEEKEAREKNDPPLSDLPLVYQRLGRELGYFDDQGNLIKPMEDIAPKADEYEDLSKKQQVEKMKQEVANLPVGPAMQNNLTNNKNDLANARPKLDLLNKALKLLDSPLMAFLPGPLGILSKVKAANDILGVLKQFVPKNPLPDLVSKIGNLFNRGKKMKDKAQDLVDNSNKLKDRFDDVTKKAKDMTDELDKREKAIDDLQKQLDDLAQRKADLEQKLDDKPKKILDDLKQQVGDIVKDAEKFKDKVADETKLKDKLLEELDKLTKEKDDIQQKLEDLKKEAEDLGKEADDLKNQTDDAKMQVDEAKQKEQQTADLQKQVEDLKPEEEIKKEIGICEDDLKRILADLVGAEENQGKLKSKLGRLLDWPKKILNKVYDLLAKHENLKLPINGIPVADKALAKLDGLMGKAKALGSVVEILTGKKSKLQAQVESFDKKLENIRDAYDTKVADLDQMKKVLVELAAQKSGIKEQLENGTANMDEMEKKVRDYLDRYNLLDVKADCEENKQMEEELAEVKKGQEQAEPELNELEKELENADKEGQQIEEETKAVEEEIEKEGELQQEKEELKKEYGEDVKLEPVETKEWAESFEVEREYWEAEFHPDDEVVEGYTGRYFEVSLKDAEKKIQLLFGPGEYFMDKKDFKDKYGKTIGAFVIEALNAMKKTDRDKVKLFVQGSADIAGHKTFKGNMDAKYLYQEITALPYDQAKDRFGSTAKNLSIPEKGFTNDDLPNLRGNYLREMIRIYSKKLDPILLEGQVKGENDEKERNAVIYLFIPEELVEQYGR